MKIIFLILLISVALHLSNCQPSEDLIHQLPGLDRAPYSNIYSGYVPSGKDEQFDYHSYYMYIESENDPKNDPVVVWTNGGPGASSMFGLFIELGPYYFSKASLQTDAYKKTGIPSMFRNEYSWTKFSNVLIINSPPPVAFSYCNPPGPSGKGDSCGNWTDEKTAWINGNYLENFLEKFPHLENNEWYITGESYAGVYVPNLVKEILNRPNSKIKPLLKGFAVGDGCLGTDVLCGKGGPGPYYDVKFFGGHNQFSEVLQEEILHGGKCSREELIDGKVKINAECQKLLDKMKKQIGGYYAYSLYDTCWYDNSFKIGNQQDRKWWSRSREGGALNDYSCGGQQSLQIWLGLPEVKKTLNVPLNAFYFSGDNGVGFNYTQTEKNVLPFYQEVVRNTSLRVLIYNGDTDPALNSLTAQNWTRFLGFEEKEEWRPWTIDGKQYMGGYVTRYQDDFDFLTIRGSGHMVPQYKPKEAFYFITKWIKNEEWQKYVAPSEELEQVTEHKYEDGREQIKNQFQKFNRKKQVEA